MCESSYEPYVQLFAEHDVLIKPKAAGFIIESDEFATFIDKMYWTQRFLSMQNSKDCENYPSLYSFILDRKCDLCAMFITLYEDDYSLLSSNIMWAKLSSNIEEGHLVSERLLLKESKEEFKLLIETILNIFSQLNNK